MKRIECDFCGQTISRGEEHYTTRLPGPPGENLLAFQPLDLCSVCARELMEAAAEVKKSRGGG